MPSIRSLLIASTLFIGAVFAQEAPEQVKEPVQEEAPVGRDLGLWTFSGGQVVISAKGQTARVTEEFAPEKPFGEVTLKDNESLKLALTLRHAEGPARPHQAFLLVKDITSQLETYFPLTVKGTSGKAKVEVPTSKIPPVLLQATEPLELTLMLGSPGQETYPSTIQIGTLKPTLEKPATYTPPVRYRAKDEIHHIFNADPKSPPKILTLVFLGAVLASLVGLVGAVSLPSRSTLSLSFPKIITDILQWALLGANLAALPSSLKAAPVSNLLFLASIAAMEGTFAMYYLSWNLFRTLAVASGIAVVAVLSGRGALRDARARRLAGQGR
ncbi:hypothetical protein BJ508DRAFT_103331 [Ascobolus immersus RN42]|uniref:Ribophorin II C-terminal domain-containing protein n=1 Tax=Ascobolus immersus RN42 TaxID=1160509 RepID=A0A3N4IBH7_ASCIM|nr:hypothetical protein BJ508DRAFT_103331 [Ascobolus immersus RN42]